MILFWLLLILAGLQALAAARVIKALSQAETQMPDDAACPRAAVILPLRGADPDLSDALEALFEQDYPNYQVLVVLDSKEDPARQVLEEVLRQRPAKHVRVGTLASPRSTCSLKVSALLQAIRALDENVEVVALCDADTMPHDTWLRELVAPLSDRGVVVSSGLRWYMPEEVSWGALVRYLYNVGSLVHAYLYGFGWAGTMAIKVSFLRDSDLTARWEQALGDDTLAGIVARSYGRKQVFVPSLIMVNRETCTVPDFIDFCRRQLLSVRLHHPAWASVVAHGVVTTAVTTAAVVGFAASLFTGRWWPALWLLLALLVYAATMAAIVVGLEYDVRRLVRRRRESTDWIDGNGVFGLLLAAPLAQLIYCWVLLSAAVAKSFRWRGIDYQIVGRTGIRMLGYAPYRSRKEPEDASESL
jgi:cellulose synthase/poly-beta-1,6-N-acetylglucosamine synthase-like glycosyltransferase